MRVVVAGGGLIGGELVRRLLENKHDVTVIDQRRETCDKLYAETGVIAVNGAAEHIGSLNEAEVRKADVVVAATGSDANNLACAILAKSLGVDRIIVRMRDPEYDDAYRLAGADSIVRVTDLMVSQMITEIEQPEVRNITTIGGGRGAIFMIIVPEGAAVAGRQVAEIAQDRGFPPQCVFIAAFNQKSERFSIPRGHTVIDEGDELFLISTAEDIKAAVDFLTAVRGK